MAAYPWFRWWVSDFHGDARVRLMTAPQRGAYRDLLDLSWEVGPLADPEAALEAVGWTRDLWLAVRACWTETPEGWIQGRLEEERENAEMREQRGRKAAAKRWDSSSNAQASPKQCLDHAIPEPEPEPEPEENPEPPLPPLGEPPPPKTTPSRRRLSKGLSCDEVVQQARMEFPALASLQGLTEALREHAEARAEDHGNPYTARGLRTALGKLSANPGLAVEAIQRCLAGSGGKVWLGLDSGLDAARKASAPPTGRGPVTALERLAATRQAPTPPRPEPRNVELEP